MIHDHAPVSLLLLALALASAGSSCQRGNSPGTETAATAASADLTGTAAAATGEVTISAQLVEGTQVAFTIANGRAEPAELLRSVRIEQEADDGWHELEAVGEVWIRDSCTPIAGVLFPDGEAERCLELAGLTQLESRPWLGTFGDAQCACERCVPVPAGRYRIILRGCHGERIASNPIAIRLRDDE